MAFSSSRAWHQLAPDPPKEEDGVRRTDTLDSHTTCYRRPGQVIPLPTSVNDMPRKLKGKHVALMMTDLSSSTQCWIAHQELMFDVIRSYALLIEERLKTWPHRVHTFQGDGHFLTFNTVDDAARAALWIRDRWNYVRLTHPVQWEHELEIRIAIHEGRVFPLKCGKQTRNVVGSAVNQVARLIEKDHTKPNQILVSPTAYDDFSAKGDFLWGGEVPVILRGFGERSVWARLLLGVRDGKGGTAVAGRHPTGGVTPSTQGSPLRAVPRRAKSRKTSVAPAKGEAQGASRAEIQGLTERLKDLCGTPAEEGEEALTISRRLAEITSQDVSASMRFLGFLMGRWDHNGFAVELEHYQTLVPGGDVSMALFTFAQLLFEWDDFRQSHQYVVRALKERGHTLDDLEPKALAQEERFRRSGLTQTKGKVRATGSEADIDLLLRRRVLRWDLSEYDHLMGKVLLRLGDAATATKHFESAWNVGREGAVLVDLADALQNQGRWEESEKWLDNPACPDSGDPRGMLFYGRCLEQKGGIKNAEGFYKAAKELCVKCAQGRAEQATKWSNLGRALLAETDEKERGQFLAIAAECSKQRGEALRKLKMDEDAAAEDRDREALVEGAVSAYVQLMLRCRDRGNHVKANALMARAVALRPELGVALDPANAGRLVLGPPGSALSEGRKE